MDHFKRNLQESENFRSSKFDSKNYTGTSMDLKSGRVDCLDLEAKRPKKLSSFNQKDSEDNNKRTNQIIFGDWRTLNRIYVFYPKVISKIELASIFEDYGKIQEFYEVEDNSKAENEGFYIFKLFLNKIFY